MLVSDRLSDKIRARKEPHSGMAGGQRSGVRRAIKTFGSAQTGNAVVRGTVGDRYCHPLPRGFGRRKRIDRAQVLGTLCRHRVCIYVNRTQVRRLGLKRDMPSVIMRSACHFGHRCHTMNGVVCSGTSRAGCKREEYDEKRVDQTNHAAADEVPRRSIGMQFTGRTTKKRVRSSTCAHSRRIAR